MALDHYVSQVHLKNFYAPELGERMFATRKVDLKTYTCDSYSQCRIEEGSTNPYLQEPRVIEDFLKEVEPRYNTALQTLRDGKVTTAAAFTIAGFAAYVASCSPAGMRIHTEPLRSTLEVTAAMLDGQGLIPPAPPELGNKSITELLESGEVVFTVDPKYPQSMGIQTILARLSVWGNSGWEILINEHEDSPFFTSDYPIVIERSQDPRVLNRIVPLAPNLAIRIYPDLEQRKKIDLEFNRMRFRTEKIKRSDVMRINAAIVQCAETTVYSSHNRPWVAGFIDKYSRFRIEPETQKLSTRQGQILLSTMSIRPIVE